MSAKPVATMKAVLSLNVLAWLVIVSLSGCCYASWMLLGCLAVWLLLGLLVVFRLASCC